MRKSRLVEYAGMTEQKFDEKCVMQNSWRWWNLNL